MNRNIFTRRHAMREAIFNAIAGLAIAGALLALMLAYFDVLVK